jgi:hypothetical protein
MLHGPRIAVVPLGWPRWRKGRPVLVGAAVGDLATGATVVAVVAAAGVAAAAAAITITTTAAMVAAMLVVVVVMTAPAPALTLRALLTARAPATVAAEARVAAAGAADATGLARATGVGLGARPSTRIRNTEVCALMVGPSSIPIARASTGTTLQDINHTV